MIGLVEFRTPAGTPYRAVLGEDGHWRCPDLPSLERLLNARHAPGEDGRAELRRVAEWLRGVVVEPPNLDI